ncbi:MAG: hypothetical protein DGJ47_000915 [Rickettsiaceae bacterium]
MQNQFESFLNQIVDKAVCDKIALAVSGGADSMAMLYLTSKWAKKNSIKLLILNVDHNLRPESKQESELVEKHSKILGYQFHSLKWANDDLNLSSKIQERAREERYQLMTNQCLKLGCHTLMTAHHLDDLLETYLMRKRKKSGALGLSHSSTHFSNEVQIIRPLLEFDKSALLQYLRSNNIPWAEDSSNHSDKYERNRVRKELALYHSDEKSKLISEMNQVNKRSKLLNEQFIIAIAESLKINSMGFAALELNKYKNYNSDVQIQLLNHAVTIISGKSTIPRFRSIEHLIAAINQDKPISKSLHGCILKTKNSELLIYREKSQINNVIAQPKNYLLWDDRFEIQNLEKQYSISTLSHEDYINIKKSLDLSNLIKTQPFSYKSILFTLPVIKKLEKVVAIPHISYYDNKYSFNNLRIMFKPRFISRFTHFL